MKPGSENRPHCWLQAADSCYWTELTVILNVVFWTTNTLQHTIYNDVQNKTSHKPNKECIYGIFSYNPLTPIIYHVNLLYCTTACWDCNQSVWRLWTADRHGVSSGHVKHQDDADWIILSHNDRSQQIQTDGTSKEEMAGWHTKSFGLSWVDAGLQCKNVHQQRKKWQLFAALALNFSSFLPHTLSNDNCLFMTLCCFIIFLHWSCFTAMQHMAPHSAAMHLPFTMS